MSICRIEEKDEGRSYPRTCPICKLSGACAKGLDREGLKARIRKLEAAQGVAVNPLEWRDSFGVLRAETPFGDYMVMRKIVRLPITSQAEMVSDDPQAAAQADYERRIRSALTPAPVTRSEAARVLLEKTNPVFNTIKPTMLGAFHQTVGSVSV